MITHKLTKVGAQVAAPPPKPKPELVDPRLFPRMVYKDLEKDGDVSNRGNQRTVCSPQELRDALAKGWFENPNEAVGRK